MKSLILALGLLAQEAFATARKIDLITIRLGTVGNQIAFDKTVIHGTAGRKLLLRFVNDASKGSEILHNVAIVKPGSLDQVIIRLQKNAYDLEKMRQDPAIIGATRPLAPAEEDTIEIQLPEAGAYPYICLMAGHSDMLGMKGVLIIDP